MKYAFITRYKKTWPVDLMCRLLGVTRNGYYSYCKRRNTTQPDPEHRGNAGGCQGDREGQR